DVPVSGIHPIWSSDQLVMRLEPISIEDEYAQNNSVGGESSVTECVQRFLTSQCLDRAWLHRSDFKRRLLCWRCRCGEDRRDCDNGYDENDFIAEVSHIVPQWTVRFG